MVLSAAVYYVLVACVFFILGMLIEPIIAGFMAGGNKMDYTIEHMLKKKKG